MLFNYQAQKLLSPWFLPHCEHQDSLSTSGFSACANILMSHFLYLLCNRNNTISFWTPDCPLVICKKKWAFGFIFGRELCFSLQFILFLFTALAVAAGSLRGQADQSNTTLFRMITLSTALLLFLIIIFIPSHSPLTFKCLLIKKKKHTHVSMFFHLCEDFHDFLSVIYKDLGCWFADQGRLSLTGRTFIICDWKERRCVQKIIHMEIFLQLPGILALTCLQFYPFKCNQNPFNLNLLTLHVRNPQRHINSWFFFFKKKSSSSPTHFQLIIF